MFSSTQNAFCFRNLSHVVLEIFRFFENHAQNLNTPQNNSASWDLQMGFNSAFKELKRYYQVYCKILSNVIKEIERIYYNNKFGNQTINLKPIGISLRSCLVNNILKVIDKS
jgi:hypothetical protein